MRYRIFHGKYLRFMSGLKNLGQILDGESERGIQNPEKSKINFSVPSRNNLYTAGDNKVSFLPGINEDSIKTIANHVWNKPMKLAIDGGKISRGKGKVLGDIDCWGFEGDPNLLERKENLKEETEFLDNISKKIDGLEQKGLENISKLPHREKGYMLSYFKTLLQCICNRNKLLRERLLSLERSEIKFRILGGADWRQSKYYPVICSIRVNIVDTKKLIEEGLAHSKHILFWGAIINGKQKLFKTKLNCFVR